MNLPVIPVLNGILPRPEGGVIHGIFLDEFSSKALHAVGEGGSLLLCPWSEMDNAIYPVGVIARLEELWPGKIQIPATGQEIQTIFAAVQGRGRIKVKNFRSYGQILMGEGTEYINLNNLRSKQYPVICGAGWKPLGGYTEFKGPQDLPVTIYGIDYESGAQVEITANLGGLVSTEKAHTVEHAIIRSLDNLAICTPKTLVEAMEAETAELKYSVEVGMRYQLPEVFGLTGSGVCGNPLTNLAQFYLAKEYMEQLSAGKPPWRSLEEARRKTLSRLTKDLDISTEAGLRVLQGLKRGMMHDDSTTRQTLAKKILGRFPVSPWQ